MRAEPPYRTADWERVVSGEILWPNCDAIRTSVFPDRGHEICNWGGVAIIPGEFSDVDMRLHHLSTGARDGFTVGLADSDWHTAQSDFILINFRETQVRQYDVGLLMGHTQKVEDYTLDTTQSYWGGRNPDGLIGQYSMGADEILELHEFSFNTPGSITQP